MTVEEQGDLEKCPQKKKKDKWIKSHLSRAVCVCEGRKTLGDARHLAGNTSQGACLFCRDFCPLFLL